MADKYLGAVAILRSLQKHWIWNSEPFTKGQAWVDMIMLANYEDRVVKIGKYSELVKRGEFITSQFKLASRWKWSRQKVRDFLKLLENPKIEQPSLQPMIAKKTTKSYTKITILNYNNLQPIPTKKATKKPKKNNQEKDINNNIINKYNKKERFFQKKEEQVYAERGEVYTDDTLKKVKQWKKEKRFTGTKK